MDGVIAGVKVLFFDVDDTLYSPNCGLGAKITSNIEKFLVDKMGVEPVESPSARARYQRRGTALAGLVAEATADFSVDEYIEAVYGGIDYTQYIKPNPELKSMLEDIGRTRRVWAFSNTHKEHVLSVLAALNIPATTFEGIVEARGLHFVNKPTLDAYENALRACGDCDARQALLIDDNLENVEGARKFGMQTIHVTNADPKAAADETPEAWTMPQASIPDIMYVRKAYPDLFYVKA
jgi:putative hydrolase of the HAD superfamily